MRVPLTPIRDSGPVNAIRDGPVLHPVFGLDIHVDPCAGIDSIDVGHCAVELGRIHSPPTRTLRGWRKLSKKIPLPSSSMNWNDLLEHTARR